MYSLRSALLLLSISVFFAFDDFMAVPSCKISGSEGKDSRKRNPDDLAVMFVADLMLKGSDASFVDRHFRDFYVSKFLKKSIERRQPDMLVVLGDVSAKGSSLISSKWLSILQQFEGMLGPFMGTPLHIVLGDRDIGQCSKLNENFVGEIAISLPGLNSAGCGAFQISNISFLSLNDIALLCGNNDLRFGVEKVIEREHLDLKAQMQHTLEESTGYNRMGVDFSNSDWRPSDVAPGSGPVVLLHLPLHRPTRRTYCGMQTIVGHTYESSRTIIESGSAGPYELSQTLPQNATEYIFHSLKPRMAGTHSSSSSSYTQSSSTISVDSTWEPSLRDWEYDSYETDPELILANHAAPGPLEVESVEVIMTDSSESETTPLDEDEPMVEVIPIESSPFEIIIISFDPSGVESHVAEISNNDHGLVSSKGESLGMGADLDLEGWGTSGIDPDLISDFDSSKDSEETKPTEEESSSSSSSSSME